MLHNILDRAHAAASIFDLQVSTTCCTAEAVVLRPCPRPAATPRRALDGWTTRRVPVTISWSLPGPTRGSRSAARPSTFYHDRCMADARRAAPRHHRHRLHSRPGQRRPFRRRHRPRLRRRRTAYTDIHRPPATVRQRPALLPSDARGAPRSSTLLRGTTSAGSTRPPRTACPLRLMSFVSRVARSFRYNIGTTGATARSDGRRAQREAGAAAVQRRASSRLA